MCGCGVGVWMMFKVMVEGWMVLLVPAVSVRDVGGTGYSGPNDGGA